MRDVGRYGLMALLVVGCGGGKPKPLPPPDLSTVQPKFAPAQATLGQALGLANQLSFDGATRGAQLDRVAQLGVKLVRRDFLWADLEPSAGAFDFAKEDAAVDDSVARGITTIGLLAYNTPWAAPGGDVDAPPDPQKFAAFAEATARHFAGRVDAWEIWNEPNAGWRFWHPREDGGAYAQLLVAAYAAIKRGNPRATVLTAGFYYHYQGVVQDAIGFVEDAFTAVPDLYKSFDVLALHPYTRFQSAAPPESSDAQEVPVALMVSRMRALLDYYGARSQPIWATEYGFSAAVVDTSSEARFLVRGTVEAMAAGAERVCVYTLDDDPNAVPPDNLYGLFAHDGTIKPSGRALKTLAAMGASLKLTTDLSSGALRDYQLGDGATKVDVVFATDGAMHAWTAPAGATVYALDGSVTTATPTINVGGDPLLVVRH